MHSPRSSNATSVHAFTLAEVMMATVVVLVAVVGMIQAVTIGSEMLDVSRKQTVALLMIRNEIDNVHLKDWAAVSFLAPTPTGSGPATGYSVTINAAGTGLSAATQATGTYAAQTAFALTNFTQSYTAPYTSGTYDDNTTLMGQAKGFTLTLVITTVKTNMLQLTYTVGWTAGNRHKSYTRSGTTYYARYGLNLYYRK